MNCIAVWATMKLAKANFYGNQHRIEVGEGSGNQSETIQAGAVEFLKEHLM